MNMKDLSFINKPRLKHPFEPEFEETGIHPALSSDAHFTPSPRKTMTLHMNSLDTFFVSISEPKPHTQPAAVDAYIRRGDPQTRSPPPTRYRGHWLDIARDAFLNLWTLDDESHRLSPSFNFPIPPALLRHFKSILSANLPSLFASKKICNFALSNVWMRNWI